MTFASLLLLCALSVCLLHGPLPLGSGGLFCSCGNASCSRPLSLDLFLLSLSLSLQKNQISFGDAPQLLPFAVGGGLSRAPHGHLQRFQPPSLCAFPPAKSPLLVCAAFWLLLNVAPPGTMAWEL